MPATSISLNDVSQNNILSTHDFSISEINIIHENEPLISHDISKTKNEFSDTNWNVTFETIPSPPEYVTNELPVETAHNIQAQDASIALQTFSPSLSRFWTYSLGKYNNNR